jgi:hypothetical protein
MLASGPGGGAVLSPRTGSSKSMEEGAVEPNSLLTLCSIAFAAVFTILAFLALAMRVITVLFPEPVATIDATLVAAISGAAASVYPGARVTRIEEER